MTTTTTAAPAPPAGDARQQQRAARQNARQARQGTQRPNVKPKAEVPAQADQGAPAATPAKAAPKPRHPADFHVLPRRGKTKIASDLPASMIMVESVQSPWEPGAQRLLALPEGATVPGRLIVLAHVKTQGWLGDYKVIKSTEAKALQVWDVASPAPAITVTARPAA